MSLRELLSQFFIYIRELIANARPFSIHLVEGVLVFRPSRTILVLSFIPNVSLELASSLIWFERRSRLKDRGGSLRRSFIFLWTSFHPNNDRSVARDPLGLWIVLTILLGFRFVKISFDRS